MNADTAFAVVFLAVFAVIALGGWFYGRRLDPQALKRWYPRFSILCIAVLAPFLIAPMVVWGQYMAAVIASAVIVVIAYVAVAKTRVCEACGTVTQPQNLFTPADFCPKCGAALSPNKILA
jgi:hypothetical protein